MIELKNVSKFYSNNGITNIGLHNINLTLHRNEIVAITGESGSGKSTLLNVISKIDGFDEGEIYYCGNETSYFSISDMDDFRKNKVGFIFQNYNIIDSYTVLDNVMIPLLLKGLSKQDARVEAMLLIKKVGLDGRENHHGSKLSGGEKQRCVIARALAGDCDILACDEPTGNLGSETAMQIIQLLQEVSKDKLVLIVTHNYSEVEHMCTRLLKMADGKIIEDIVFKEPTPDPDIPLDLDYKPLSKKVIWSVGYNNIIRTPKKTIFAAILFFVIAFCYLFLTAAMSSALRNDISYSLFNNNFENRLFVYCQNGATFEENQLSDFDYSINDFSSEIFTEVMVGNYNTSVIYADYVPSYDLVLGRKPENDNEFVLLLPNLTNNEKTRFEQVLNQNLSIYSKYSSREGMVSTRFTVVGVGSYDASNSNYPVVTGNNKLQTLLDQISPCYYVKIDGVSHELNLNVVEGSSSPTLYIPTNMLQDNEISVYCDMYEYDNITIKPYNGEKIYLEIYLNGESNLKPYFASVYVDKMFINNAERKLKEAGFKVSYPVESSMLDVGTKLLVEFLSFIMAAEFGVYLIGVFFIAYVILGRIYRSRIKDYGILRTLGVTNKDMSKIVKVEMCIIGFGITIFNYLLFNGLIYSMSALAFLRNIGITAVITYFVVMVIFVLSMAKRFNKRLFKFTVRQTLGGDEEDD